MNICDILVEQVKLRPNAPAVYSSSGNLTYAELGSQVATLSAGLVASGVKEGDVVALRLDDAPCHLIATLAVGAIGATVLSVPRSMPEAQRDYLFAKTNCKIMLSGVEYADITAPIGVSDISFEKAQLVQSNGILRPRAVDASHIWLLASGSGSTGKAKIIPITHGLECRRARTGQHNYNLDQTTAIHSMIGIHFLGGKRLALEIMVAGGANYLSPLSFSDMRTLVDHDKLNIIFATPYHIERILEYFDYLDDPIFSRLSALYVSSATISSDLRARIRQWVCQNINILYGTNECGLITIGRPKDVFVQPNGVGKLYNSCKVEIVDAVDNVLPISQIGMLRVKTDDMIEGYYNDREATEKAFRGGWYYPGDLGYFSPDGQLIHLGRADNMMIVSGVNLYPAQVENCLMQVNGVREVAVKPLPHKSLQDLPCALVVVEKGLSLVPKELLKKVHDEVGRYALYDIEFVERLPFNEQGKLTQDTFVEIFQKKWARTSQSIALGPSQRPKAEHDQEFGTFKLKIPEVANSKMLANWVKALDSELPPLAARESDNRLKSPAYAWVAAVLDLVVTLAQALRMPIFERFDVVGFKSVSDSKNVFSVSFRLPAHDLVPADLLEQLLKLAISIASWTLGKSPNNANQLQQFFQIVQDNVRAPFSDKMSPGKSTFYVLRAAHKMGIPYFYLPNGVFQLGLGANARRIHRSTTDRDSALGATWSKNKRFSGKLLHQAGLPAPEHREVSTFEEAKEVAEFFGYPVVVKPTDLERGEGVSVDVDTSTLEIAFEHACRCSPSHRVLVERQIEGTCHRLFIAEGKLLYAVKRLPIGVYADGLSSVMALVEKEYNLQLKLPPWKRSGIQLLDDLAQETLVALGLSPKNIPEVGTFVPLRRIETTAWGGVSQDVTNSIHADNVELGLIAADLFGLGVAGVDIMSSDITQPWHYNGAAINEINFAPLLGGGEVSNRHMDEYINRILVNQGRIRAHVYEESPASVKQAHAQWNKLRSKGLNAYFISETEVFDGAADRQYLSVPGLQARVRALVLRKDVQGIVVVAKNTNQVMRLKKMLGTIEVA